MLLKNSISLIKEFFSLTYDNIRKIYLNSNIYNKKISSIDKNILSYKPTLSILSCLIKYEKKKNKIEDFYVNSIWEKKINNRDFKNLHSFYWLFTIDLKSSKKITHSIIQNWIDKNQNSEFRVAIRCGHVRGNQLELFAGAGLVQGSTVEEEMQEVALKFEVLINQLNLDQVNYSNDLKDT